MEEETKEPELKVPVEGGPGGKRHLHTHKSWRGGKERRPLREALTPAHQSPVKLNNPCRCRCRPPVPQQDLAPLARARSSAFSFCQLWGPRPLSLRGGVAWGWSFSHLSWAREVSHSLQLSHCWAQGKPPFVVSPQTTCATRTPSCTSTRTRGGVCIPLHS